MQRSLLHQNFVNLWSPYSGKHITRERMKNVQQLHEVRRKHRQNSQKRVNQGARARHQQDQKVQLSSRRRHMLLHHQEVVSLLQGVLLQHLQLHHSQHHRYPALQQTEHHQFPWKLLCLNQRLKKVRRDQDRKQPDLPSWFMSVSVIKECRNYL